MDLLEDKIRKAWQTRVAHFPSEIEFDFPGKTAVISLTGMHCALNCAHCGGHYLHGMTPVWEADVADATSCLISGGCDAQGKVPVLSHLEAVKSLMGERRMNWHVGLISETEMAAISPYVDTISFDFLVDDETIQEVYGLKKTGADYLEAYQTFRKWATVVPHVTIGLKGGEIVGEYRALEALRELGAPGVVFIVFTPTKGTAYQDRKPPVLASAADIMAEARLVFPDKPLYLGCMRPHGPYRNELDCLAIRCGFNAIVKPSAGAVKLAKDLGLEIKRQEECCVL